MKFGILWVKWLFLVEQFVSPTRPGSVPSMPLIAIRLVLCMTPAANLHTDLFLALDDLSSI